MFDALASRFDDAWKKFRGLDKISPENIQEALKDVRRALLEADVNLQVVKQFIASVQAKAEGAQVVSGVNPGQQFVKIVYDELVAVMGESQVPLARAEVAPTVVLMAGLQGTGKTTATAKLALHLRKEGRSALMVAADVYRPAAIDQLQTLGKQINIPVFSLGSAVSPIDIARQGVEQARSLGLDTVLVDTAGRLQIDAAMMDELAEIKAAVNPHEILLVVDAMTGQEAANLTQAFHDRVGITGAILTKTDGDSRGGAALSVRQVSGQPIKFVGTGEKVEALEPFYPDRLAQRILGMGDVLTLVEKAQEAVDLSDALQLQEKILTASFGFDDFVKQMRMMKNMGSLAGMAKLIPGLGKMVNSEQLQEGEARLKRVEAAIGSMTLEERRNPDLLAKSPSRCRRIAKGCGQTEKEINRFINDFQKMREAMKMMGAQMGMGGMPGMPGMPGMGGGNPLAGLFGGGAQPGQAQAQPGFRGYTGPGQGKKKKAKKKKGFGEL